MEDIEREQGAEKELEEEHRSDTFTLTPWSATGASLIDTPAKHTLTKSFTLLGASNPPSFYLTFLFGKIGEQYHLL